jgi:fructose 1,6-bisphosphate aldolase/phosphatase
MGPGYAELELTERPSEPVICFLADKTEPGAWNLALYKMFADPFQHRRAGDRHQDARRVPV